MRRDRLLVCTVLSVAASVLSGCGLGVTAPASDAAGVAIRGSLHGGQQPVSGSHVFLMAAGNSGYGASATSLLTVGDGVDPGIGTYVLSDANGNFTLTARYTCTAGAQVYALALGGSPGVNVPANSAIALMTAVGTCPAAGTFAGSIPFVEINEVTTVAATNALAGFMTGPSALSSSGTTLAQAGVANAFATAASLAVLSSGTALATVGNNGIAPQAKVNTLADIIAACVNSTGGTSSPCATLFSNARNGSTVPTETITALLNIAHNPGANVAALYGLSNAAAPFQPTLGSAPNDFALTINYTTPNLNGPDNIRTDAAGNVYFRNDGGSFTLEKLSPTGSVLSGSSGYNIGGQNSGDSIALDAQGNIFVGNRTAFSVYKLNSTGMMLSTGAGFVGGCSDPNAKVYAVGIDGMGNVWGSGTGGCALKISNTGTLLSGPAGFPSTSDDSSGIALDSTNAAWIVGSYGNSVRRVSATGTLITDFGGSTVSGPSGIAIDASDSAWIPNHYYDTVTHLLSNGTVTMVSGAGIHAPFNVSIDGASNVWLANNSASISAVSNSGAALSGATGYSTGTGIVRSIAIDGSGNVWTAVNGPDSIVEFVGSAVPAARPILPGHLGMRP